MTKQTWTFKGLVVTCVFLSAGRVTIARADADTDMSLKDFLSSNIVVDDKASLKDVRADIQKSLREYSGEPDRKTYSEAEKQYNKLAAEKLLNADIKRVLPQQRFDAKVFDAVKFTKADYDKVDATHPMTKVVPIDDKQKVSLVAVLSKGSDGKTQISFTGQWNPKDKDGKYTDSQVVRDNFSDKEISDYIKNTVGDDFGDKITVADPVTTESINSALSEMRESKNISRISKDFRDQVANRGVKLGSDTEKFSLLADAKKNLDEKKGSGRAAIKSELNARLSLLAWLKTNSAGSKTPCQIFEAALGGWAKFPPSAREDCPDMDPAVIQAKADKVKTQNDTSNMSDEQAQAVDAQRRAENAAACDAKAAITAMQATTDQIIGQATNIVAYIKSLTAVPVTMRSLVANLDKKKRMDDPMAGQFDSAETISADDVAAAIKEGMPGLEKGAAGLPKLRAEWKQVDDADAEVVKKINGLNGINQKMAQQVQSAMLTNQPLPIDPNQVSPAVMASLQELYKEGARIAALKAGLGAEIDSRSGPQGFTSADGSSGGVQTGNGAQAGGTVNKVRAQPNTAVTPANRKVIKRFNR